MIKVKHHADVIKPDQPCDLGGVQGAVEIIAHPGMDGFYQDAQFIRFIRIAAGAAKDHGMCVLVEACLLYTSVIFNVFTS